MSASTTRRVAQTPNEIHDLFAAFANAGDVEGLVSLFEANALGVADPDAPSRGSAAIRTAMTGLVAQGFTFDIRTDRFHEATDLALMTNTWTATTAAGTAIGGRTTEVARRQPDGRWLLVIDDPNWIA